MLEFAYTGEVNVAQDLLPTLLHTARAYRIKGLDKVESPVGGGGGDPAPPPLPPPADHWGGGESSAPPTRPHSPAASNGASEAGVKTDHFLAAVSAATQRHQAHQDKNNFLLNRERESQPNSR